MKLALDIGNSAIKIGVFDGNQLVHKNDVTTPDQIKKVLEHFIIDKAIVSNVGDHQESVLEVLSAIPVIKLSHKIPLPIRINYQTPETLGHDRIAAACGATSLFPNENCLVIDCGTCITYDMVTAEGEYLGGAISPGLRMRLKSLNTFTSNLPLIEVEEHVSMVGKSTKGSIQSGVIYGIIGEIEGYIHRFSDTFRPLTVVMCGGDTYFFENKVKARIFAAPELVLRGLNRILQHHA